MSGVCMSSSVIMPLSGRSWSSGYVKDGLSLQGDIIEMNLSAVISVPEYNTLELRLDEINENVPRSMKLPLNAWHYLARMHPSLR